MIGLRFDLGDTVIDQHGNRWTVKAIEVSENGIESARCERLNRPGGLRLSEWFSAGSFAVIEPVVGGDPGILVMARSIDWWLECAVRAVERVAAQTGQAAAFEASLLPEEYADLRRRMDFLASALNAAGLLEIETDGKT